MRNPNLPLIFRKSKKSPLFGRFYKNIHFQNFENDFKRVRSIKFWKFVKNNCKFGFFHGHFGTHVMLRKK